MPREASFEFKSLEIKFVESVREILWLMSWLVVFFVMTLWAWTTLTTFRTWTAVTAFWAWTTTVTAFWAWTTLALYITLRFLEEHLA